MDTREKLIKARLGLLALAEQWQNVRQACKAAGISRSHYYEIQQAYEKYGPEGLAPQPRRRPRMPNQTPPELERQILEMTTQFPTYSYVRIAGQLRLTGVGVSAAAVRAVWQRHGLTLRVQRIGLATLHQGLRKMADRPRIGDHHFHARVLVELI